MQITGALAGLTQSYQLSKNKTTGQEIPADLFKNAIASANSSPASTTASAAPIEKAPTTKPDATAEFMKYMKQTPAEQMQSAWLAQHGISKEEFDKMDPKDKEKLVQKMEQELKEKLAADLAKPQYKPVNIFA